MGLELVAAQLQRQCCRSPWGRRRPVPACLPAAPLTRPSPLACPGQTITDLLDPSRTNLQVRENLEGQYVSNLTAHECSSGAGHCRLLPHSSATGPAVLWTTILGCSSGRCSRGSSRMAAQPAGAPSSGWEKAGRHPAAHPHYLHSCPLPVQWDMYRLKRDPRFKEKFPEHAADDAEAPSLTVRLKGGDEPEQQQ